MTRYALTRLAALVALALLTVAVFAFCTAAGRARLAEAEVDRGRLEEQKVHIAGQLALLEEQAGLAGALPADLSWPGADRAEADRALQAAILELSDQHGLTLSAFVPANGPATEGAPSVALQIEGTADWAALLTFIDASLAHRPAVGLSDLSIRTAPTGSGLPQPVIFRLVIWGFAPALKEAS